MDKCSICKLYIKINNEYNKFDYSLHYLLCDSCIKIIPFVSKTEGLKTYLLSENDIKNLKILYPSNKSNTILFRELDMINQSIKKYGTIDKLFTKIQNKTNRITQLNLSKNNKIVYRKKKLMDLLEINKLPFYYRGDPYLYINYGKPNIETVLINESKKITDKQERISTLAKALKNNKLPFDENMESCYNYINNIKCCTIIKVIHDVKELVKQQKTENYV